MQTTLAAAMLQSHMRSDEGQLIVELAVLRHIYVCSDVNMSLSQCCWWCIIVLSMIVYKDMSMAHANYTSSDDATVSYAT